MTYPDPLDWEDFERYRTHRRPGDLTDEQIDAEIAYLKAQKDEILLSGYQPPSLKDRLPLAAATILFAAGFPAYAWPPLGVACHLGSGALLATDRHRNAAAEARRQAVLDAVERIAGRLRELRAELRRRRWQ